MEGMSRPEEQDKDYPTWPVIQGPETKNYFEEKIERSKAYVAQQALEDEMRAGFLYGYKPPGLHVDDSPLSDADPPKR